MLALPETRAFSSGESPHPVGLIGQNRSRRAGDGSEFHAIRPFQPGDRLRRVNWRTTLRTGELHAVGTSSQEDSAVLILLDAVTDVGASGGVDGAASTLDVGVRAASALAAHHIRVGDRVSLRVIGRTGQVLGPGSGGTTSAGCRSCSRRCSPAGRTCSPPGGCACGPPPARSWWCSRRC